jgi:tight adherence protein C
MLILSGVAIGVAILVLYYVITLKPSAARANLMAGIEAPTKPEASLTRGLGTGVGRFLPSSYIAYLDTLLVQAGHPWKLDRSKLLGVKVLALLFAIGCGFLAGYAMWGIVGGVIAFFLVDLMVQGQRDKRKDAIRDSAADIIDQLVICVEAGLGFDAAFTRVGGANEGPLATELQRAVEDMRAGVPRDQALRGMADRTQLPEIGQLTTALIQAQKNGVSVSETLRIKASEWRDKRKQAIEEKAAKLAVKLLMPTMICFLPVFFVILVVPALSAISHSLHS